MAVLLVLVVANIKIYQKKEKLIAQIENLKNKIESIKNENEGLRQGILDTNKEEYIEKVAREQLDLQKPGEKVVSFIKEDEKPEQSRQPAKNFLQIWLGWLSSIFKK